jgi:hypothetical protein
MAYGIKYADSAASAEYYHPPTLVTKQPNRLMLA